jgi:hypothetical protein
MERREYQADQDRRRENQAPRGGRYGPRGDREAPVAAPSRVGQAGAPPGARPKASRRDLSYPIIVNFAEPAG